MRTVPTIGVVALLAGCAALSAPAAGPRAAAGFADADSLRTSVIAPGVQHVYAWYAQGPWAVHVVEVDATQCVPVLEARKPGPPLSARETTSRLAGAEWAAVNADFFMLPGGTPVGAHATAGVPLIGPTHRQVFAAAGDSWWIGVARMDGAVAHRGDQAPLVQVNRPAAPFSAYRGTTEGVTLFTAWIGDSVPADSSARRVRLRLLDGNEAAGRAVVLDADSTAAHTRLAGGQVVLLAHGSARDWARRRSTGDTVGWHVRLPIPAPVGRDSVAATEVIGGFPELLRDGTDVLGTQVVRPDFGEQRHPRTAIGWTADRSRLFLVVVDGRQPPYSAGMSLPELTWLFRRMGASDALNFDGGGSTAMLVRGALVSRPSDREGERAVGNALVLTGCAR